MTFKTSGSLIWWCGHLVQLALCGLVVQAMSSYLWEMNSLLRSAPPSRAAATAFNVLLAIGGAITITFFLAGHRLIKKMQNKS